MKGDVRGVSSLLSHKGSTMRSKVRKERTDPTVCPREFETQVSCHSLLFSMVKGEAKPLPSKKFL